MPTILTEKFKNEILNIVGLKLSKRYTEFTMSGDGLTIAVALPTHNGGVGEVRLANFVYGNWVKGHTLQGTSGFSGTPENFGSSVAFSNSGSRMIVGSRGYDFWRGVALVFDLLQGSWICTKRLYLHDQVEGDAFGFSVGMSADGLTVIVGAPGREQDKGLCYIYKYEKGSDWSLRETINITSSCASDHRKFGYKVEMLPTGNVVSIVSVHQPSGKHYQYLYEYKHLSGCWKHINTSQLPDNSIKETLIPTSEPTEYMQIKEELKALRADIEKLKSLANN